MTYYEEDDEVVPELMLRIDVDENNNNNKGDYLKLREYEEGEPGSPKRWSCGKVWYWVKLALFLTFLGLLAAVFIKWVGPFFMDKVSLFIILQNFMCACDCVRIWDSLLVKILRLSLLLFLMNFNFLFSCGFCNVISLVILFWIIPCFVFGIDNFL